MRPDAEEIGKATQAPPSPRRVVAAKRHATQEDTREVLEALKIFVILTALTVAMVLAARWLV